MRAYSSGRLALLAVILTLGVPFGATGHAAAPPKSLTPAQIEERAALVKQFLHLRAAGKNKEAILIGEKLLTFEHQVLGPEHADLINTFTTLAEMYEGDDRYPQAVEARKSVLALTIKHRGKDHWLVAEARLLLKNAEELNKLPPNKRQQFRDTFSLMTQAVPLFSAGKYAEAHKILKKAADVYREIRGEKSTAYALALVYLANVTRHDGQAAEAATLYEEAAAIWKDNLGDYHPMIANCLNGLALCYSALGEHSRAEPLYKQAIEINKQTLGVKDVKYAESLATLATHYRQTGSFILAVPLYQQALQVYREQTGEKNSDYALLLRSFGELEAVRGDFAHAEQLFRRSAEVFRQTTGVNHPEYATLLEAQAVLANFIGDHARGEQLALQSLRIRRQILGAKHVACAGTLQALAYLYSSLDEPTKAEECALEAIAIRKHALGESHPYYAEALGALACLYRGTAREKEIEALSLKALDIYKKTFGERHFSYVANATELAWYYQRAGDLDQAEKWYAIALANGRHALGDKHLAYAALLQTVATLDWRRNRLDSAQKHQEQALAIGHASLELSALGQSERQQLENLRQCRSLLDMFLSLAEPLKLPAAARYAQVLSWKGAVLAQQRWLRQKRQMLRDKATPETAKLLLELETTTRRLAALALARPDPKKSATHQQELAELFRQKEELEQALASASQVFRQQMDTQRLSPERLQKILPKDAVLVDFLEYTRYAPTEKVFQRHRHLLAFTARRDGPLVAIDLGPVQPIAQAVDQWRRALKRKPGADSHDAGTELRRLLWQPLEKHLAGARLVLVSPDGPLGQLPFAALPGAKAGTFIIEEVAVAVVPVAQMLPELLAERHATAQPQLLALGDVDYDAVPGASTAPTLLAAQGERKGSLAAWSKLPGTVSEIGKLTELFQKRFGAGTVQTLRGSRASESALRAKAGQATFLHLATHGFFAPPQLKSALVSADKGVALNLDQDLGLGRHSIMGLHPGLLSGLVLAGANRPPEEGQDDGILTALEVAELDLSKVDLAVLSACQTGLGKVAGGEGLLGLQRAFQVAGARTVVASLWSIPDAATSQLMQRFYANLWDRKMGKLEALRAAQLWMLREGRQDPEVQRGLVLDDQPLAPAADGRLPPYFWAAFVLSGAWR